jgi:hypothetical protein
MKYILSINEQNIDLEGLPVVQVLKHQSKFMLKDLLCDTLPIEFTNILKNVLYGLKFNELSKENRSMILINMKRSGCEVDEDSNLLKWAFTPVQTSLCVKKYIFSKTGLKATLKDKPYIQKVKLMCESVKQSFEDEILKIAQIITN